jgi:hypothetical protein
VEETAQALRRFLRRVSNGNRPRVLAIATSAVREAPNRARLLLALRDRDGIDVRVAPPAISTGFARHLNRELTWRPLHPGADDIARRAVVPYRVSG